VSSILSAPQFATAQSDFDEWFNKCYKFEFSRAVAFEIQGFSAEQLEEFGGEKCPGQPDNKPSIASQVVGYMGESLVPLLVGYFFSRKMVLKTMEQRGTPFTSSKHPLNVISKDSGVSYDNVSYVIR